MGIESAAERRLERNVALVAGHPRWHGILHPELIPFPPRRYSRLDMLPAIERARAYPCHAERSREIVAAHPRWRGIRHPEHIFFPARRTLADELLSYRAAWRVALNRMCESDDLYEEAVALAAAIDRRTWPWAASPSYLTPAPEPRPRRRLPPLLRLRRRSAFHVRPVGGLLPH